VRQSAYGEVIPSYAYAVIDEAHQLEDVATQYFGISVSNYRLERLVGDGRRWTGRDLEEDAEAAQTLYRVLGEIDQRAALFFAAVRLHRARADRTRLDPDVLEPAAEPGRQLASAARNTPEVGNSGSGSNTANVEILTMVPPPRAHMWGVTRRVGRITLSRYVSMPTCHSSSEISSTGPFGP